MGNTVYLTIASILYFILLIIAYFSKKRINLLENKVYSFLIITSFIELIMGAFLYFSMTYDVNSFINIMFNKIYLISAASWIIFFTMYIIIISFKEKIKSKQNKIIKIFTVGITICCLLILLLPIDVTFESKDEMYTSGLAVNFTYITAGICIAILTYFSIKNLKNLKDKKFLPLYLFVFLGALVMFVQYKFPSVFLLTPMEGFLTFLMYFTIENPDMKMIAQLNEAKAQAEKANNAKSEFLSSMSHEIRTPLNAIVGFSQALSEEDINDSAKDEVKDIISASNTLLELVNGILDISKIEANKLEIINKEYNFKNVFDELVVLTKGRLGDKPLDFRYKYDESIPPVLYGDHVRVKQIILNLLTNSVKYTREGSIDFNISSIKKNGVCRIFISVEDTGIGIKPENINKLFTKFERFDEKNTTIEGTGLGLAITKQLIELMNGKIVVQSVYGKGSKFTVALDQKIVEGKVLEKAVEGTAIEEFDATGKRVLVVDDNNLNLKVASRLIKNYKCEIITALSGMDCLDLINKGEKFDLILMDDMMPRMSGSETLIRLKKIDGFNMPVVALTANAVTGMKEKYINQGFDEYLAKPIEKPELNRILKKFLK